MKDESHVLFETSLLGGDDEISFSSSQNYCVGVVDIVNSTGLIAGMENSIKIRKFLSIFINSMALIVRNFDGTVIKNVGDSLLFYFPDTSNSDSKGIFKKVFECFAAMLDARPIVNTHLYQEGLPAVNYRISADYGRVEIARSRSSKQDDLFGSTVSLCTKINPMAQKNGIIIGEDLYRIIHSLKLDKNGQKVMEAGAYSMGLKFAYSVYEVISTTHDLSNPFRRLSGQIDDNLKSTCNDRGLKNIMIIDDEPDALQTFKLFLDETACRVHTFKDGEEALRKIAAMNPGYYDLIITDIRMAPINGLEFYARLARITPDAKILFLSALDAAQELLSLFPRVKSQNILKKPVNREQFIKTVEALTS
ncbi:MAG: response regulator [Thaumarchaeota archaeon]|nr:response regulator [Nitrososphaerota archaeon]